MELEGQGPVTEQLVVDFLNNEIPGLTARYSTRAEDHGIEIGGKEIDVVAYLEGKPAMAFQVTSQFQKGELARKRDHARDYPFVRLQELKNQDPAIPRVSLVLEALEVSNFAKNPNFAAHPELAIKILDRILLNLEFDLRKTANPIEQTAVKKLIPIFEETKRRFIH